jgi:biotin carboxyl carrier protein
MNFITSCGDSKLTISEKELLLFPIKKVAENTYHILYKNKNYFFQVEKVNEATGDLSLILSKKKKQVKIEDPVQQMIRSLGYNSLKAKHNDSLVAPMPGLVLDVLVAEGAEVKKGDHLLTLEAMKMENILKAAHDGTIKKILVKKADKVDKNQLLLLFEGQI